MFHGLLPILSYLPQPPLPPPSYTHPPSPPSLPSSPSRPSSPLHTLKVDPYYLYNPDSRLAISQETRVNCSSKEFEEKQKELKEQDKFSAPVKFPTECFFFTVLCSHIAWIPLFRRYRNYLSEVRRMQRSIAEFEAIKQREDVRLCLSVCQSVCLSVPADHYPSMIKG